MIYGSPRPLMNRLHGDVSVVDDRRFDFAREINAAPLTTPEFARAARALPIVFVGGKDGYTASVLLGLRDAENLLVEPDGRWSGSYVPAFLRRYPFVFSYDKDRESYTLCIDEASGKLNREGRGEALYDEKGEMTPFLKRMGDFTRDWEAAFQRTKAFCRRLEDLALLTPHKIAFQLPDGQRAASGRLAIVDRERLKSLAPEKASELLGSGDLELIYAHLLSLPLVEEMVARMKPEQRTLN